MSRPTSSSTRSPDGRGVLVRVGTPVEAVAPEALLEAFRGLPRGFWGRGGRWCAWAGSAAEIVVGRRSAGGRFREVRRRARAAAERLVVERAAPGADGSARFHGGLAFDPRPGRGAARGDEGEGGPWAGFPAALFRLPAVELRSGDGDGRGDLRLAVTVEQGPEEDLGSARTAARGALRRVRARLSEATAGDGAGGGRARAGAGGRPPAEVGTVRRRPGRDGWSAIVEAALGEVRSGRLEKVVPARAVELELDREPSPVDLARRLRAGNPESVPFLVEPEPGRAFAGAAPEIVAALRDGRFHATAVAGTVADAADPGERDRLARRLLSSEKDRREHAVGVRDMRRALQSVTGVARVDQRPRVLRLRGVQHLLTNVSAEVPAETHVLELLGAMHPTAAVNGSPRDAARDFLRREEPFDRGWYAGPVGWFDTEGDGEFAPGLRSVLLRGRRVRMFAGAGVVDGSVARREWRETGLKFRPALEALDLDPEELVDTRAGALASGGRRGL